MSSNLFACSSTEEAQGLRKKLFTNTLTPCTIWLTGLSGAGKSTIAYQLEEYLLKQGVACAVLDGDNVRSGLNNNLSFSDADRIENIRRIGEVCLLKASSGIITIVSIISPSRAARELVRTRHQQDNVTFIETFVSTTLETCEQRDVKGLYKKARAGIIQQFTGISSPYEEPEKPELTVDTSLKSVQACVNDIHSYLVDNRYIHVQNNANTNTVNACSQVEPNQLDLPDNTTDDLMIDLQQVDYHWLHVLADGWAHPLSGFMIEREYLQCLHFNAIDGGTDDVSSRVNMAVPIVLPITTLQKESLTQHLKSKQARYVMLRYQSRLVAMIHDPEFYQHRKEERCARTFGITDAKHPYIKDVIEPSGDWLVGGKVSVLVKDAFLYKDGLDSYRLSVEQVKQEIKSRNADCVYAFQLRNAIHNGHLLMLQETRRALLQKGYKNPVLLLHPLGGWTKDDDVPLSVRVKQHEALIQAGDLDANSTILAIFPSPMMYAGPREVQFHARARQLAGADFYIVGRDPAGVKHPSNPSQDLYNPDHGKLVLQMAPGLEGLHILPFQVAAYDIKNGKMSFVDPTRPMSDYDFISGSRMRSLARDGKSLPDGFMSPQGWAVLADYYKSLL